MVLHLFRHIEHTAAADIINRKCNQMSTDENLFLAKFLVKAKPLGPTHFGCRIALWGYVSRRFRLRDKSVGKVVRFYQKDVGTDIVVELDMPSPMTADVPRGVASFGGCQKIHREPKHIKVQEGGRFWEMTIDSQ